jgi:hypothetical protein
VTPFLKILTEIIEFGCTPEAGAPLGKIGVPVTIEP